MNKTTLQGKWRRMRGNLKTEWGRWTENDRRQLDGKLDQMIGMVQERYGYTQEGATKILTHYLGDYGKRAHKPGAKPANLWRPVLTLTGVLGLAAIGWFFFSQLLVEKPEIQPEPMAEPDYVISPEMDLV